MFVMNEWGSAPKAHRAGQLQLELVHADGQPQVLGMVDGSPDGTDRTVYAMFGGLRAMRLRAQPVFARQNLNTQETPIVMRYMQRLYRALRTAQTFVRDPEGVERIVLRGPEQAEALLSEYDQTGRGVPFRGDCDDVASFACTCLILAGLDPVLCVSGDASTTRDPMRFRHILWGVRIAGGKLSPSTVLLADSQEGREPGHWPAEGAVRLYATEGEHSVFN